MLGEDSEEEEVKEPNVFFEVKKVELAMALSELEAYRTALISELENLEPSIRSARERMASFLRGEQLEGVDDDKIIEKAKQAQTERRQWGKVRDFQGTQ